MLSGGESDGALGIAAIRGALGLTLGQEPKAARFGIMPACAIATRCVDYILEPEQLPAAYLALLQSAPDEAEALLHELLVGATTFFRAPPAIEALKDQALPALLARTPPKAQLRVWVAGCARSSPPRTSSRIRRLRGWTS